MAGDVDLIEEPRASAGASAGASTDSHPAQPPGTTPAPDDRVDRVVDHTAPAVVVDLVVPVYNEEQALEACLERLTQHLAHFPFTWRITIADNASTDRTWDLAAQAARSIPGVRALHLPAKGRGRALRAVWGTSDAQVVAYTDVDLSTDLKALLPMVAAVVSGHSDLAIGSRLSPGARVVRGPRRELISRSYNLILRSVAQVGFSDAQCGFKAVAASVARQLLPEVENDNWFFDTELLLLAEGAGLRILEVPVDWEDDPDSRVDVPATALEDLRGLMRVTRRMLGRAESDGSTISDGSAGSARAGTGVQQLRRQARRFVVVGSLTTLVHLGLFAVLSASVTFAAANAVALSVATLVNTALNRVMTFGFRGRHRLLRDHAEAAAAFLVGLMVTSGALLALGWAVDDPPIAVGAATILAVHLPLSALRFVLFRAWVFNPARRRSRG